MNLQPDPLLCRSIFVSHAFALPVGRFIHSSSGTLHVTAINAKEILPTSHPKITSRMFEVPSGERICENLKERIISVEASLAWRTEHDDRYQDERRSGAPFLCYKMLPKAPASGLTNPKL